MVLFRYSRKAEAVGTVSTCSAGGLGRLDLVGVERGRVDLPVLDGPQPGLGVELHRELESGERLGVGVPVVGEALERDHRARLVVDDLERPGADGAEVEVGVGERGRADHHPGPVGEECGEGRAGARQAQLDDVAARRRRPR